MGAILLAVRGLAVSEWEERFRLLAPECELRIWPDRIGDTAGISYVCAWQPPPGLLASLPKLSAIFSLGAGVDHLLSEPDLPNVPIVRIVDPDLTMRMSEYLALHVLLHHRRQRLYDHQQRLRLWREHDQPPANAVSVGVMGLGVLGADAAAVLHRLGFRLAGWSRTPKAVPGIACLHGDAELDRFLAMTEILICLLPATAATSGILRLELFRKLRRDGAAGGAYLINAGRGALQIESDILTALDEGTLAGATLDVFATEPLPSASPLWSHPRVTVTPHIAAFSDPGALAANVLSQIKRFETGLPLQHVVDRAAGY